MAALEGIIKWAQGIPKWQADAVRRLLEQGALSDDDHDEIYHMVKVSAGIEIEKIKPIIPKIGAFSGTSTVLQPIMIQRISEIQHVNAIDNGSTIPFGHQGITVIYGENGSGKSSYARVLKKACRARDTKDSILPNIFDSDEEGPASATIKITEGMTKDIKLPWVDGVEPDHRLASITFFDSKCARVIVDENNEATYIPYGCEVFDSLVSLIKYVKSRLQIEKPIPVKPSSGDMVPGTDSEVFLNNLNRKTKPSDIKNTTKWTGTNENELTKLVARIAQSETGNLLKEAQTLEATAERCDALKKATTKAIKGLSKNVVSKVNNQLEAIAVAEKAVELAAEASLQNEPLPSGMSNEWKLLYEAAKEFSTRIAYPDSEFPATGSDELCVLCQQELSEDARNRLHRFQQFIEDQSEQSLQSARSVLTTITDEIETLKIPKSGDYSNVLNELSSKDRKAVKHSLKMLQKRKNRLKEIKPGDAKLRYKKVIVDHKKALASLKAKLTAAADQAKKDAEPQMLKEMEGSRDKLASRRALNRIEKDIRSYVSQKILEFKYDLLIQRLSTRAISEKSKEIISAGLSPQLKGDLTNELKRLNAEHLPLAVNITGREGGARHQMTLEAAKRAKPSDILSEGELGVVAVAGFMAELGGAPVKSPIVLDDPVSSLDHQYCRKIARRLVDEAKHRQVIVFTHNIAFLVEIEKRCAGIPLTVGTVTRSGTTAGKCIEGLPWEAMQVRGRLTFLDKAVNKITSLHGNDNVQYNKEAAHIYNLLRETWEALIEHDILNGTVRRHDTDVGTKRLMEVEIKDEDYKKIDEGMSRCSGWMIGHDKSQALSVNRPNPNEIRCDIQSVRDYSKDIKKRNKEVRERRKAVLKPLPTLLG